MSHKLDRYLREIDEDFDNDDLEPDQQGALPSHRRDAAALLSYALNVMRGVENASPDAAALVGWLAQNRRRMSLPDSLFTAEDNVRGGSSGNTKPISRAQWRSIGGALTKRFVAGRRMRPAGDATVPEAPCPIGAALQKVTAALGLDELDAALFGVGYRYRSDNAFERLFDVLARAQGRRSGLHRYPDLFALLVGARTVDVSRRLRADGPLAVSGAFCIDHDGDIGVASRLRALVEQCIDADCDIRTEMLGKPLLAKLPWEAFTHLGREIEVAVAVLQTAMAAIAAGTPEPGVHILLYGLPGTGKTELARTIAAVLGVMLHAVGEQSENGEEPRRAERLSSLLLAQRIGAGTPALYLFDEAEDLFRPRGEREPDPKIFVHRLLETATVPMIWAANELEAFSPAVLRRMAMCIEVRLPNQTRRATLWQELAKSEGVALDAATAGRLARLIPAAPSVARTALRATRLADGDAETAALVARGMARAIGHGHAAAPEPEQATLYDPALSHADQDLADLTARLTRPGAPVAISLLLSGPPGTGKTAFARHLAFRMGLEVLQKRGSDIFGPFVGQTEANIAAAFAEAQTTGAFLLFDEADSLLFDRANAVRGWELSQVNEMLTWMEQHSLPFACTTNIAERLDKASLRRFLIRLNFDFLTPAQTSLLFRRSFALEPPAALARLDRLTPADFSRIARRCAALDMPFEAPALLDMLAAEIEGRDGAARAIGFARKAGR